MIGPSEKSGIEIKSEYQLTGHPVFDNKVIVTCIEDCSPNQFRTQATKALFDLGPAQSSSRGQLKTPAYRGKLFFAVAIQSIVVIKTE